MGLENPLHIAVIVVLLLLVFGAKRLPEIGRSLGTGMREFKQSITGESSEKPALGSGPQQPPLQASPQNAAAEAAFAQPAPAAPSEQPQPQQPAAAPQPTAGER